MKKRPLRVLFLPTDEGGCGWYRIRQWDEFLSMRDDVESDLMDGKEQDPLEKLEWADVVVTRLSSTMYAKEIKMSVDCKKPIVFDHDDNTMEILPTSEHYKDFGTQDAYLKLENEVKPVWVTGHTEGFDMYRNLWGQMSLLYQLGAADMITTPVPNLTKYFMEYAKNDCLGAVVPNCINFDMYPEGEFIPKNKKKGEIRLGWQGGVSHLGDWQEISPTLTRVLEDYPEVTMHIMGSFYKSQFAGFKERITYYPWVPWKGFTYRLKTIGLDGAIIPLENAPFNEYKSEIKFTEFSQIGVPCLVKDMLPYSMVCKGGKNSYTYKTPEEFEIRLREMIEDLKSGGKKAKKYVKKARKWVKNERNVEEWAGKLAKLYKNLLPSEVQEQLM